MEHPQLKIALFIIIAFVSSCKTSKTQLNKSKTEYGIIKFYLDNKFQSGTQSKRVLATIDNEIFYSFYPDKIIKQLRQDKNSISTLYYGQISTTFDTATFKKLSSLDTLVLIRGGEILDSLGLTNYKKPNGATAFEVEINYYHGYPNNKKFRP